MVKNILIRIFIFYGLVFMESEAANPPSATSQQILQCQLSLQKISARLRQITKDHTNQKYYDNLYKQTQEFLKKLDTCPLSFLEAEEMWAQCQNLLKFLRMIRQPSVKETPSLSLQGSYLSGQLMPRTFNKATVMEIRYYRDRLRYVLKAKEKKEEDNIEDPALTPSSLLNKKFRTKSIDELEKWD